MTDIVLVQTAPWGLYAPPLGLAYLASFLKIKKISTEVFDINMKLYKLTHNKSFWDFTRKDDWSDEELFNRIKYVLDKDITFFINQLLALDPLVIGLSVNQNSVLFSLELARRIKQLENRYIVAGGWGCFNKNERDILLRDGLIDAFVIGEGEEVLCELIKRFKNNEAINDLRGVSPKCQNNLFRYAGSYVEDLDALPYPTYEEFELNNYISPVLCLLTSRGCVGRCVFCNDRVYQGKIRFREPEKIAQEIEYHVKNNKINNFSFNDLAINADLKHLGAWSDLIIKKKLIINWDAQAFVREDMDLRLFCKMKKAGCNILQFGIESGSDKILQRMKKAFKISDAEKILHLARKSGIKASINLIVGFPGESEVDFLKTVNFVKRNRPWIDQIGVTNTCNVVFNSELMEAREDFGIILSDNHKLLEMSWYTADGNCKEMRKERLFRLLSFLKDLGLPIGQDNSLVFLDNIELGK